MNEYCYYQYLAVAWIQTECSSKVKGQPRSRTRNFHININIQPQTDWHTLKGKAGDTLWWSDVTKQVQMLSSYLYKYTHSFSCHFCTVSLSCLINQSHCLMSNQVDWPWDTRSLSDLQPVINSGLHNYNFLLVLSSKTAFGDSDEKPRNHSRTLKSKF